MPRRDPVLRKLPAGGSDVGFELGVPLLPTLGARREQTELFEVTCQARVDAGALAQLVEVELVFLGVDGAAPLAVARGRRCELLANDA